MPYFQNIKTNKRVFTDYPEKLSSPDDWAQVISDRSRPQTVEPVTEETPVESDEIETINEE